MSRSRRYCSGVSIPRRLRHVEGPGEFDDGADDLEGLIAVCHASDEGSVDLEKIEGEGVEVVERAVARAEVIHEQRCAEGA